MKKVIIGLTSLVLCATIFNSCTKKADPVVVVTPKTGNVLVLHASPDAPGVDLLIDDVKKNTAALAFDKNTGYLAVTAGSRNFKVNATGTSTTVINKTATIVENKNYTIIAANKVANIEAIVVEDDLTAPAAGKAHVRFAHLSPDAPAVDIVAGTTTLFGNAAFKSVSAFKPVDAGSVTLKVRLAGTTPDVLSVPVVLVAGKIYTVYAKGLLSNSTLGASIANNN